VTQVARAQPGDDEIPDGTVINLLLLRQKSVQEELKLSPEVAKKVVDFCNMEHAEFGKALKLGDADLKKKVEELDKANKKFLKDNLSEAQHKRLDQIRLQVTGLHHLIQPETAKALDLTKDQQTKFKKMHEDARKRLADIFGAKDKDEKNKKLAKLREETNTQIWGVLTDAQKEKVKALVGEPFKGELLIEDLPGASSSLAPSWRDSPLVGAPRHFARADRATATLNDAL
jgi:hypothetical protein